MRLKDLAWFIMMRFVGIAVLAIAAPRAALAQSVTASGPTALALAAVVAQHSPLIRAFDNGKLGRLFRGSTNFGFTPNTQISVTADSIVCTSSNVDITMRSWKLTFSARNRTWERSFTRFQANEIGATALAAGASSQGAKARSPKASPRWNARSIRTRSTRRPAAVRSAVSKPPNDQLNATAPQG